MNTFEDAMAATEEMFANAENETQEEPQEQPQEEPEAVAEEQNPEENKIGDEIDEVEEQNAVLDDAVNTAEVAAQAAQEKDMQLQQALREIEMMKAQNMNMQSTIEELSKKNEEALIEDALQMPTLDINSLAFADDETINKAQAKYAQDMAEYLKAGVMKDLSPFVEQAKQGIYEREKADMVSSLSQVPELVGISEMLPQIEKIIANNKWLQSDDMPMDEKLINAYAIAKGVNSMNTPPEQPKELTDDELMKLYDENPTFQELIEKKRLDTIKQSQQVPPFSASSGAVNAALNIKEKPKTFEEAAERTRQMFGLE